MASFSRDSLTPPGFHNFFSLGIGVVTAQFTHSHDVPRLIAAQVLWLSSLAFISARGRRRGGKFLDNEVFLYHGFGIPLYVAGLLFAACFYTATG
jgi:hypothetical protein